jgi:hypothetical protein
MVRLQQAFRRRLLEAYHNLQPVLELGPAQKERKLAGPAHWVAFIPFTDPCKDNGTGASGSLSAAGPFAGAGKPPLAPARSFGNPRLNRRRKTLRVSSFLDFQPENHVWLRTSAKSRPRSGWKGWVTRKDRTPTAQSGAVAGVSESIRGIMGGSHSRRSPEPSYRLRRETLAAYPRRVDDPLSYSPAASGAGQRADGRVAAAARAAGEFSARRRRLP